MSTQFSVSPVGSGLPYVGLVLTTGQAVINLVLTHHDATALRDALTAAIPAAEPADTASITLSDAEEALMRR